MHDGRRRKNTDGNKRPEAQRIELKEEPEKQHFYFPPWADTLGRLLTAAAVIGGVYYIALIAYATSPLSMDAGYQPPQPVEYSHKVHAGDMGIDCRYCHNTVEIAAHAAVPPTQTCINCHSMILKESEKMIPVNQSYSSGMPVQWVRVHDLPDYAYFDHSAHVSRGVSCVSCHDRIDRMEVVYQAESLRMGWCLECHRNPELHLRPVEHVTDLGWQPMGSQIESGLRVKELYNIDPPTDCSTCHR